MAFSIGEEEQRAWLLRVAQGVQAWSLLVGDYPRYAAAAEVEVAARNARDPGSLRVDYSSSLNDGTRIRISR